ncbi:oligosaccharide biosynthesis protein Alg14 like-domain-containing protein [Lineolata rhizophorae]|uniref:UDP-N-acetylglucosamine transferase subunit ALG14 n=1 Tax=Lineolata rhizophorae TaxID=578093 RepID=A0A6A6PD82_9PEZI|nr:oligosaccharide biosynthesis protein Alg14 like-domain-containing protein [Lineolata rhizophorae]
MLLTPLLLSALLLLLPATLFLRRSNASRRPRSARRRRRQRRRAPGTPTHLCIALGSGGHTAEMLAMLAALDPRRWTYRTWVVSSGDGVSAARALEFEAGLAARWAPLPADACGRPCVGPASCAVRVVPRARRVHQPLWSAPASALCCLAACVNVLLAVPRPRPPASSQTAGGGGGGGSRNDDKPPARSRDADDDDDDDDDDGDRAHAAPNAATPLGPPDLVLTNGPGTGVVLVLAALVVRAAQRICLALRVPPPVANHYFRVPAVRLRRSSAAGDPAADPRLPRTVFVESLARVKGLSLSGRLLLGVVDRFVVQWEGLAAELEAQDGRVGGGIVPGWALELFGGRGGDVEYGGLLV